jgi:hypothetical protein
MALRPELPREQNNIWSLESAFNFPTRFFENTGAVAGVFVLVGLAAASIFLWVFFAVRRRRRTQRLEGDAIRSSQWGAGGGHRSPLDDGDDEEEGPNVVKMSNIDQEMGQRRPNSSFVVSTGHSPVRTSRAYGDLHGLDLGDPDGYNPYNDYAGVPTLDSYVPARTSSPPVASGSYSPVWDRSQSEAGFNHSASPSAGSMEPLLAAYHKRESDSTGNGTRPSTGAGPPTPPPRNPKRLKDRQSVTPDGPLQDARPSTEGSDQRLTPGLKPRPRPGETESIFSSDLRDEEDYSRPVLAVSICFA